MGTVISLPALFPYVCVSPGLTSPMTGQVGKRQAFDRDGDLLATVPILCANSSPFSKQPPPRVLWEQDLDSLLSPLPCLFAQKTNGDPGGQERSGRARSRRGRKGAGLMKPCHSRAAEMGEVSAAAGEKRTRSRVISDTREAVSAANTLRSGVVK